VASKTIREAALEILKEDESELGEGEATTLRIGHVLHKRRIKKLKRERNRGANYWEVTQTALDAWARAYGLRGVLEDASFSEAKLHPSEEISAISATSVISAAKGEREVFWL
jgi:hypothetical protein